MAEQPDPIDVYVGNAIRARRKRIGVSQERVADAIGVSFQQVQKYENGKNRVSASMLCRIAHFLNAPAGDFFPPVAEHEVLPGLGAVDELAAANGGRALAHAFMSLPPHGRSSLVGVAEAMSEAFGEHPGASYITGGDEGGRARVS